MTGPSASAIRRRIVTVVAVLLGLSFALELVIAGKPYFTVAGLPGFSIWTGLGAGAVLILLAVVWSALLRRSEEVYDD